MDTKTDWKKARDKGSVVVETAIVLPLFIFLIITLYLIFQSRLAELYVYEAASETAEYMAQFSYLRECDFLVPQIRFTSYVDDENSLKKSVQGGEYGVNFVGTKSLPDENQVELHANYSLCCLSPFFLGNQERNIVIIRRAYVGDKDWKTAEEEAEENKRYVYISDNKEAYHRSRSCSYLTLEVNVATKEYAMEQGYDPCGFCGDEVQDFVYITAKGENYHSRSNCTGLKRSVKRVLLEEVAGLPACTRCGKE